MLHLHLMYPMGRCRCNGQQHLNHLCSSQCRYIQHFWSLCLFQFIWFFCVFCLLFYFSDVKHIVIFNVPNPCIASLSKLQMLTHTHLDALLSFRNSYLTFEPVSFWYFLINCHLNDRCQKVVICWHSDRLIALDWLWNRLIALDWLWNRLNGIVWLCDCLVALEDWLCNRSDALDWLLGNWNQFIILGLTLIPLRCQLFWFLLHCVLLQ